MVNLGLISSGLLVGYENIPRFRLELGSDMISSATLAPTVGTVTVVASGLSKPMSFNSKEFFLLMNWKNRIRGNSGL